MDLLNYEEKPRSRTRFFWWSVFIILLTGACFASWIGCFYVVQHPENPKCYALLKKLKRLDPPKRFEVVQVPTGDFLTVAKLLERFGKLGPAELAKENARLLRQYLTNYREAKRRVVQVDGKALAQNDVVYVVGRFDVLASRALESVDLFPMGGVVLSQSMDSPQVLLESVFPAEIKTGKLIEKALPIGSDIILERSRDLLALVHVARLPDGRMLFSAVPLPYNSWQSRRAEATIHLKSPEELEKSHPDFALRVASGMPIMRGEQIAKATKAYAEYRRSTLASGGDKDDERRTRDFVRFDDSREETDAAVTPRVVKAATPAPVRPVPTPAPTQPLVARPMIVAPPSATAVPPPTTLVETPAPPAPTPVVPRVVPPVSASSLPPGTAAEPPKPTVPRRIVNLKEAVQLAGETTFAPSLLTGDFTVASVNGENLELRDPAAADTAGAPGIVVKVKLPAGQAPPKAGDRIRRGPSRGLAIQKVVRESDGRIVIEAVEP